VAVEVEVGLAQGGNFLVVMEVLGEGVANKTQHRDLLELAIRQRFLLAKEIMAARVGLEEVLAAAAEHLLTE
jgi:hypothetical protein